MLVAGVGNIFLGDDGFGCEVAHRLAAEPVPSGVLVRDYGVGGVHLAYDLLDGYGTLVLVDALPRGGPPGSVYVVEVTADDVGPSRLDAHGMDPEAVLGTLDRLGGTLPRTLVVGCEPASTEQGIGLTPEVAAAVEVAAATVRDVVARARPSDVARQEH